MDKILLTLDEAARLALIDREACRGVLDQNTVLVAQLSILKPLLGGFYREVLDGRYPRFTEEYLKLPLALWVKSVVLQNSVAMPGALGAVRQSSPNLAAAGTPQIAMAIDALRSQARVLMECALEHLGRNRDLFPGYTPAPRRRLRRILGGVIL